MIPSIKFSFPKNIRNLHLGRQNCSWDRLIPKIHLLCSFYELTFDSECTEPTLLRLHYLRTVYAKQKKKKFPRPIFYAIILRFIDFHFMFEFFCRLTKGATSASILIWFFTGFLELSISRKASFTRLSLCIAVVPFLLLFRHLSWL
jgi:hypothetical protein